MVMYHAVKVREAAGMRDVVAYTDGACIGNLDNERCDQLAVTAARGAELLIDSGYISSSPRGTS